jgi:septal ring factor EnvC (AmiA/AmiB activator)
MVIRKIKAQIEHMNAQLRHLEVQRRQSPVDARIVYGLQLAMLRERRDQLQSTLDRLATLNDEMPASISQEPAHM